MRIYFAGPLFTPYERSFIDECAARLRGEGIEVFVPHENALALPDTRPATIFAKDWTGLSTADAVVALLDGPMVDDGTACEIGIFYALMQNDLKRFLAESREVNTEEFAEPLYAHYEEDAAAHVFSVEIPR